MRWPAWEEKLDINEELEFTRFKGMGFSGIIVVPALDADARLSTLEEDMLIAIGGLFTMWISVNLS